MIGAGRAEIGDDLARPVPDSIETAVDLVAHDGEALISSVLGKAGGHDFAVHLQSHSPTLIDAARREIGRNFSTRAEALIEAAITPYRERDADGRIVPSPAWWDLPPEALDELFVEQLLARDIERAVDPEGLSGTGKAVLGRIRWNEEP